MAAVVRPGGYVSVGSPTGTGHRLSPSDCHTVSPSSTSIVYPSCTTLSQRPRGALGPRAAQLAPRRRATANPADDLSDLEVEVEVTQVWFGSSDGFSLTMALTVRTSSVLVV